MVDESGKTMVYIAEDEALSQVEVPPAVAVEMAFAILERFPPAVIHDEAVDYAVMALLNKSSDAAEHVDWKASRDYSVAQWRRQMKKAIAAYMWRAEQTQGGSRAGR